MCSASPWLRWCDPRRLRLYVSGTLSRKRQARERFMRPVWSGVFPAVTTQFHEDQSLDLAATERHLSALIDSGIRGLIVCGSLGENQALDPGEKRQVVELAIRVAAKRVPVLSGVAEMSTA